MRTRYFSGGARGARRWWIFLLGVLLIAAPLTLTGPADADGTGGTVVAWGYGIGGGTTVPPGLDGVTAVAAGFGHSVGLKNDGTVVAWGRNDYGQLNVPAGLTGVTAIAAGELHSLALKNDGTVVAWGWGGYGQSDVPAGLTGVTAVAADYGHSLALKSDGTVVGWGDNFYGEIDVPAGVENVSAIAAGLADSLVVVQEKTPRPDLLISRTRTGGYVGDDVYNTTAAGQTLIRTAEPGQTKSYYVKVTNDGTAAGTLTVRAAAATRGSVMHYYSGSTEITAPMRSTSGWQVTLEPGATRLVRVDIKIMPWAALPSIKTAAISGSLQGQATDVVKGKIRVVLR